MPVELHWAILNLNELLFRTNLFSGSKEELSFKSKAKIEMGKKHMKQYSISLIYREIEIKTTKIYHFIPISMDIIKNKNKDKKTENNNYWRGCREIRILCIADRNVKWYSCCEKWYGDSSKKIKSKISIESSNSTLRYIPQRRYLYTHVHSRIIYNNQKVKASQVSFNR